MTDFDLVNIYRKFEEIDRELKLLKAEVADMKWYQQDGTTGAVAYSTAKPGHATAYVGVMEHLSDNEKFQEDFK